MASVFEQVITTQQPVAVKPLTTGKSGALLAMYRGGQRAVLKPAKTTMPNGNRRQRGIEVATHPYRERAFYLLAKLIGFDHLVPETVITTYKGRYASAQEYKAAMHLRDINPKLKDPKSKGWRGEVTRTALMVPKRYWRQLLALDFIAGARDRHANNVGITMRIADDRPTYRLVAWDNAVTFGLTFAKYHNVFHKFMFRNRVDFTDVWPSLEDLTLDDFGAALHGLITDEEIRHAYLRLTFFRDDFPYRLPWKRCSQGNDDPAAFPSYADYFEDPGTAAVEEPLALSA